MTLTQAQLNLLRLYESTTLCDFLSVFPQRYEFFDLSDESKLKDGQAVVLEGLVTSSMKSAFYQANKSVTTFSFTAQLTYRVTIFNRHYLKAPQDPLRKIVVIGKYKHPHHIIASKVYYQTLDQLGTIQPIYAIKQKTPLRSIKALIHKALASCNNYRFETLPPSVVKQYRLISKEKAMIEVHQPSSLAVLTQALERFKITELLEYHIQVQNNRLHLIQSKPQRELHKVELQPYIDQLPFQLTLDQQHACKELHRLCDQPVTTSILLQGDVGSGKTVVALLLAVSYIQRGYSVAFMAPTELLAQQHYVSVIKLFPHLQLQIQTITATTKQSERQRIIALNAHTPLLIFGTHALFSQDVSFQRLGLVIIDEQHRFGVTQRLKLIQKGHEVDVLSMSATPIPRTLAAVLFADMHVISLYHKPRNRGQNITKIIEGNSFISVLDDILATIQRKEQVYVITAVIDVELESRSAVSVFHNLKKSFGNTFSIGLLHGKMKANEKTQVLEAFRNHEIDMLVSTSVIEVGVDVANATRMIIYDAHRFGLSSLHQLRGRIGRSHKDSVCYLINPSEDELSTQRLHVLETTQDGFEIARQDLALRGPGDLIGTKQSGLPSFQFANIVTDEQLLHDTKQTALALLHSEDSVEQMYVHAVTKNSLKGID